MRTAQNLRAPLWVLGIFPLVVLAILLWVFFQYGPLGVFRAAFPPVEELSVQRIVLKNDPQEIIVHVVNGGPQEVHIAQVLVDEAYWTHAIEPGRTIPRLGRARIIIPYSWVEGDAHEVMLLTSTGVTFVAEIEAATETPVPNARYLSTFTLLGLYAGVIPVFLGLFWLPFLRRLSQDWTSFFLALTAGLLLFLGVDAVVEALEIGMEQVPEAFQGVSLVVLGGMGAFLGLMAVSRRGPAARRGPASARLVLAYSVALGIGLHNLGEGLAIGTAYAIGNIALGSLLVVGFMVHNTTEGLAIVAPVSRESPRLYHFALLGILAGLPTIAGTWIGGFAYSPELSTLFLALGAGAIFQVVYQISRLILESGDRELSRIPFVTGFMGGLAIMYLTGLLVVA